MTPIDPPPGLLDKVAEALSLAEGITPGTDPHHLVAAQAAWDAVAEGLGLREKTAPARRGTHHFKARRLVSKWEPIEEGKD